MEDGSAQRSFASKYKKLKFKILIKNTILFWAQRESAESERFPEFFISRNQLQSRRRGSGTVAHTQPKQPVPRDAIGADFVERKFWKSLQKRKSWRNKSRKAARPIFALSSAEI